MKRIVAFMLFLFVLFSDKSIVYANTETNNEAENYKLEVKSFDVEAKSALLMDAETGEILFSKNEHEALPPASVTKIMTLLLVMEAIRDGRISLDDEITVSSNAASMGGSQVFLEEGERMSVQELIKCTVIASANDAAVALSEYVAGSESAFVSSMNERARELGMLNTVFENTTGLDDTASSHLTSAYDIAIMSRELIKHNLILDYSSLWQDTIRDGEFTLTNTNRLVRYYDGCTGLKTGSTDKAGYCISATAKRDNMHLICVIMGAETRDLRNNVARSLLDYGFSNYGLYFEEEAVLEDCRVRGSKDEYVTLYSSKVCRVIEKSLRSKVEKVYELPEFLDAPLSPDKPVGRVVYYINGKKLCEGEVYVKVEIKKIGLIDLTFLIMKGIVSGKR